MKAVENAVVVPEVGTATHQSFENESDVSTDTGTTMTRTTTTTVASDHERTESGKATDSTQEMHKCETTSLLTRTHSLNLDTALQCVDLEPGKVEQVPISGGKEVSTEHARQQWILAVRTADAERQ